MDPAAFARRWLTLYGEEIKHGGTENTEILQES